MKFILEELPTLGGSGLRAAPARFEWDPENMSNPRRPIGHPGQQRIRRRDYPGSIGMPTIQVLGPVLAPQTFTGTWNDRYNSPGFAKAEKRRFLQMVYRGNAVRIQFDDIDLRGLIVDWDFPYEMDWRIGYTFTVEIANDGLISQARVARVPETVISPRQLVDEMETLFTAADAARDQPEVAQAASGDLFDTVADAMAEVRAKLDDVNGVLETRLSGGDSRAGLMRASQSIRSVRLAALEVLDNVAVVRADTDLQYRTATSELRFETWSRSLGYQTRLIGLSAFRAEQATAERADPVAIATYRARAGESLYDVSMAIWGTPHYWRQLADRNRLESFVLAEGTDLIIPEIPTGT